MQTKHTYNRITWIDLQMPKRDEVVELMEKFKLHPLVAEELITPSARPRAELYKNSIYMILHLPHIDSEGFISQEEIDFVIGKKFLITSHYSRFDPLHTFAQLFEVNSILQKKDLGSHAGFLVFYMIRNLYHDLAKKLDLVGERLEELENNIFTGEQARMVRQLSMVNRQLLGIRKSLRYHKNVLETLERAGVEFFGEKFRYHLQAMASEYYKVYDQVSGHKETLDELRDTHDALLTTKSNSVMKGLSVIAFFTLPFTLAMQVMSMNTNVSFLQNVTDGPFLLVIGVTGAAMLLLFLYFKHRRWL